MTVQERFAQDWGMTLLEVEHLVRLAKRAGRCNEHACNGDPHPSHPPAKDKAEASERWNSNLDDQTKLIADLVRPYGFTEVAYTGLFPCLKRGGKFIEIPYE